MLRTLAELGYVTQSGRQFSLAPRILELGFAFLSTQSWIDRAEPLMKELSHSLHESCSAAILQGNEIVYVARMPAPHRIMSTTIAVGSRLPAFYTSLGRIQLGFLGEAELRRRVLDLPPARYTASTITDPEALVARILADNAQGYSIVDEELERGLRSIAVPIVSRSGLCVAALNLSALSNRTTPKEMRERFLPELRRWRRRFRRPCRERRRKRPAMEKLSDWASPSSAIRDRRAAYFGVRCFTLACRLAAAVSVAGVFVSSPVKGLPCPGA